MNLYIHIPFCRSKCAYCHFLSFSDRDRTDEYITSLIREIKAKSKIVSAKEAETIYFGGGTPSLLNATQLDQIFKAIKDKFNASRACEITLEANPEDITQEKLESWKNLGINRLSIGVQSLNDSVRKKIGRRGTGSEVLKKIRLAQDNFDNLSVDLIAGLPGDNLAIFLDNLKIISKLGINHISLYDLELDNDSQMSKSKSYEFLTEEIRTDFLVESWELLKDEGFKQYEISNFTRNNKKSIHNYNFWQGNDYLAFGVGASSKLGNTILKNNNNLDNYLRGKYKSTKEKLSKLESARLNLLLAIRINKVTKEKISQFEKASKSSRQPVIDYLNEAGLLKGLKLTQKGKLFINTVTNQLLIVV